MCRVGSAVVLMVMVIFSGTVLFLLWLRSVNILSFMVSWRWTSLFGLRCLLWRGWLPLLSGANGGSPWAENPPEGAGNLLEYALGSCTSGLHAEWQLPVGFDPGGAVERVAAEPDVWTDGGLVQDKVSGASSSGSGFFTHHPGRLWAHRRVGPSPMMILVVTGPVGLAVVTVLFLVQYRRFREQSSGRSLLLFRLRMVFT